MEINKQRRSPAYLHLSKIQKYSVISCCTLRQCTHTPQLLVVVVMKFKIVMQFYFMRVFDLAAQSFADYDKLV